MAAKLVQPEQTLSNGQREATLPVQICDSRKIRHAAQKNAAEEVAHMEQQRHLDSQRRATQVHLAREEKELRTQLRRLQEEQKTLAEQENFNLEIPIGPDDDEVGIEGVYCECVNPYPIVFPSSTVSTPRYSAKASKHGRQTNTNHVDDPDTQVLQSYILPSLKNGSRNSFIGLSSAASSQSASMQSLSGDLQRAESLKNLLSTSPKDQGPWAGDPEAIASVRRPRRSVAQQRNDHKWSRSQSLKEKPLARRDSGKGNPVSRSKSMKEPAQLTARYSCALSTQTDSNRHVLSRSESLREPRALMKSFECMNEAMVNVEITAGCVTPRHIRSTHSTKSSRPVSCSTPEQVAPEKSCVWGFLADPLPVQSAQAAVTGAAAKQKRQKKLSCPSLKLTTTAPDLNIEVTPPLPPITNPGPWNKKSESSPVATYSMTPPQSPGDRTLTKSTNCLGDNGGSAFHYGDCVERLAPPRRRISAKSRRNHNTEERHVSQKAIPADEHSQEFRSLVE